MPRPITLVSPAPRDRIVDDPGAVAVLAVAIFHAWQRAGRGAPAAAAAVAPYVVAGRRTIASSRVRGDGRRGTAPGSASRPRSRRAAGAARDGRGANRALRKIAVR